MVEPGTVKVSKPRSFVTLDFLRGVAALPVLHLHTAQMYGIKSLFPHAYLAVDFFFMLSGFVMTYVYQERLDTGWSTRQFMQARLLRLYPLYILGSALGAAFAVLWAHFGRLETSKADMAALMLLGLLFLPALPQPFLPTARAAMYPFDVPAWSLFYELIANIVHAVALRRKSLTMLSGIAVVFAAVLLGLALRTRNIDFGPDRGQILLGLCRVLFAYPMGIILYRVWSAKKRLLIAMPPLGLAALLLAAISLPVPYGLRALYEWLVVVAVFPLLVIVGASSQPPVRMVRVSQWLGALSYPLYILHVPVAQIFEQAWIRIVKHRLAETAPWSGLVYLAILIPFAWWMSKLYDPEARKLLQARLLPMASRVVRLPSRRKETVGESSPLR